MTKILTIILMIAVILVILDMWVQFGRASARRESNPNVEKRCPPHDWHWEDYTDETGILGKQRITCTWCGPLRYDEYESRKKE
jgi:hypothetical protein